MFALEGALAHAGASRSVIGVFEASAPILVAGLYYFRTSAVSLDSPVLGLGLAARRGGRQRVRGAGGVWAVDALAAGLAYLLVAAVKPWLRPA